MSSMRYRTKNFFYRCGMRIFMPDLARQLLHEGLFALPRPGEQASHEFMRVENNGADTTIFAFSGLDVLYAGLARYEFQNVLRQLDTTANFVFVRDIHRMGFQLKPDGSPGGVPYYTAAIQRARAELGAHRNIAIGSSIGGSAAFSFGVTCGMEAVVIFGAAFNMEGFTAPETLRRTLCDWRLLFSEPRAYAELLIVTLAARWARGNLTRRLGEDNIAKPLELYAHAPLKPAITLLYGARSMPDASQAELIRNYPNTRLVPLPTGRHNTPAFLKQRGELASRIAEALEHPPIDVRHRTAAVSPR